MKIITLKEQHILEYIKENIHDFILGHQIINNAKYHHNSFYHQAPLICKYGILTILEQNKLGITHHSQNDLERLNDTESHINGINGVSLSVVGLKDIYPHEDEYDPLTPHQIDFLVSNEVKAQRCSTHYGNEFILNHNITLDKIKSIDIRLLEYIDSIHIKDLNDIKDIINKFNYLKEIALIIKETNQDIPLREMSSKDNTTIDIDKLSKTPKIILKP